MTSTWQRRLRWCDVVDVVERLSAKVCCRGVRGPEARIPGAEIEVGARKPGKSSGQRPNRACGGPFVQDVFFNDSAVLCTALEALVFDL